MRHLHWFRATAVVNRSRLVPNNSFKPTLLRKAA